MDSHDDAPGIPFFHKDVKVSKDEKRLYDIVNVLKSLNFLKEEGKPFK